MEVKRETRRNARIRDFFLVKKRQVLNEDEKREREKKEKKEKTETKKENDGG